MIGVFAQGDVGAQQNLDQIAQSGGTEEAFFITSNQDVTQAFLAALQAIQKKTLACDYQLPAPPDGGELDRLLEGERRAHALRGERSTWAVLRGRRGGV